MNLLDFDRIFKLLEVRQRCSAARRIFNPLVELFFCKKIPLSRRVEYVMDGSMDHSVSQ